jgi:hypothetical protein
VENSEKDVEEENRKEEEFDTKDLLAEELL